jgi:hypothetical protein
MILAQVGWSGWVTTSSQRISPPPEINIVTKINVVCSNNEISIKKNINVLAKWSLKLSDLNKN